jgi:hypothetical protein
MGVWSYSFSASWVEGWKALVVEVHNADRDLGISIITGNLMGPKFTSVGGKALKRVHHGRW